MPRGKRLQIIFSFIAAVFVSIVIALIFEESDWLWLICIPMGVWFFYWLQDGLKSFGRNDEDYYG